MSDKPKKEHPNAKRAYLVTVAGMWFGLFGILMNDGISIVDVGILTTVIGLMWGCWLFLLALAEPIED
jgi:hypothetical protein